MFFFVCNNCNLRLIRGSHCWCLLPSPSSAISLFHLDACVLSDHSYFPSLKWYISYIDIESLWHGPFMLPLKGMNVDVGSRRPWGQHFVAADTMASFPACFPPSDLLVLIASGLYAHMVCYGLQPAVCPWVLSHTGRRAVPKSPRLSCQADRWMVAAWSPQALPLSLSAFFSFSTT